MRNKKERKNKFIAKSIDKFGVKFDYSKVDYIDLVTPVDIICPEHGLFKMSPYVHNKSKAGCRECNVYFANEIRRKTNEEKFLAKAIKKFGDKYDYSRVEFINSKTLVEIVCPEHGVFKQNPSLHAGSYKYGCKKCSNNHKSQNRADKNKKKFISDSKDVYGNKFDYSKVKYINSNTLVEIICPNHGSFKMKPVIHLKHSLFGCKKCTSKHSKKISSQKNKAIFLKEAKSIHGDKFDYSLVEYKGNSVPVKIICPKHGVFEIAPYTHKSSKTGCSLCSYKASNKKKTKSLQYYIDRSNKKHNYKYDYSLIKEEEFINSGSFIKIKCPEGHVFKQKFHDHINGNGCKYCSKPCRDTESFIRLSSEVHHNKYDYSKTEYVRQKDKVIVICPDHGEFLVTPTNHYSLKRGCYNCKTSHGENKIKFILEQLNIDFSQEKTFDGCRHNGMLRFDFYLPEYNACIEFDGAQHFKPVDMFGGQEYLEDIQFKDGIKNDFCRSNNIPLLRISYKEKSIKKRLIEFISKNNLLG